MNEKLPINVLPAGRSYGRKNEYAIYEDYAEIVIRKKDGTLKAKAIIDIEDIPKCKPYRWNVFEAKKGSGNQNVYVRCSPQPGKTLMLHRLLLDCPNGKDVDHINLNKLDNRRSNLRIVSRSQNISNNKSKGVYFDKRAHKWIGVTTKFGKHYYTKTYSTQEEAALARKKLVEELFNKSEELETEYRKIDSVPSTGVRYLYGKWVASFRRDFKSYYVGKFDTKEEAIKARAKALATYKKE